MEQAGPTVFLKQPGKKDDDLQFKLSEERVLHINVEPEVGALKYVYYVTIIWDGLKVKLVAKSKEANNIEANIFGSFRHIDHSRSSRRIRKILKEDVDLFHHNIFEYSHGTFGKNLADELSLDPMGTPVDDIKYAGVRAHHSSQVSLRFINFLIVVYV